MSSSLREPFDSEAGYRAAIDATLRLAVREIRIFDADLERMGFADAARIGLLAGFLAGGIDRRLHIVLHNPEPMSRRQPRLINLIQRHGYQIEVRQTPDHLRHLADRFVLADETHGALRFHADQARGNRIEWDPKEIHPLWQRFDELWDASHVCSPTTPAGL